MNKLIGISIVSIVSGVIGYIAADLLPMEQENMPGTTATPERVPLYWVAPMDASFRRNEPGLSPMGMELIPVYEEPDVESNAVSVTPTVLQNLGLRTASAIRRDFNRQVETVGYTRWNESTIEMLHPRAEGWLEEFSLESVGDNVVAGQIVYELFAPNLVSAQKEYLTARQAGNHSLASLARERLLALGFTELQVDALAQNGETSNRLVFQAQSNAVVLSLGARRGNFVHPATNIASLASLDTIWVDVDVFEADVGDIEAGLSVVLEFPAFPGEVWSGEVSYVYPELDRSSRTLRVRVVVENQDHRLKPNMFANVIIAADPRTGVLAVPREAVIRSGMGSRVIVVLDSGKFQPRAVRTGISSGGQIEILQGLDAGETVVTSGQFLLDAEADGEQAMARLDGTAAANPTVAGMMAMAANDPDEEEATFSTTGRIVSMMSDGMVTLAHEPVPALNWPAMTMGFTASPQINLTEFSVGNTVRFEFRQLDNGSYQIVVMSNAGENQ